MLDLMRYCLHRIEGTRGCQRQLAVLSLVVASMMFVGFDIQAQEKAGKSPMTFETIKGKWKGFGWFVYGMDSEKKRVRCESTITPDGSPLMGTMDFSCKSDDMDVAAKGYDIVITGGNVSGRWTMHTHEVDGDLRGAMTDNVFQAKLIPVGQTVDGFGAELTTTLKSKCEASIDISVNSPLDLKAINLAVRRC